MIRPPEHNEPVLGRRRLLGTIASVALGVGSGVACDASRASAQQAAVSKVLVVYFTRTGNTRVIAQQIRRALRADIVEIAPAAPYPEDYEATVSQAQRERDAGYQPPLAGTVSNISAYETVFLGFPIWGETTPPVIRSFLAQHDLAGKTLVPFVTHGGYGLGRSISIVRQFAPRARVIDPFVMEADQERRTMTQVSAWLGKVNLPA